MEGALLFSEKVFVLRFAYTESFPLIRRRPATASPQGGSQRYGEPSPGWGFTMQVQQGRKKSDSKRKNL